MKIKYLWISIDATGRNLANVIIGILSSEKEIAKEKYLIKSNASDTSYHHSQARWRINEYGGHKI